MRAPKDEFGAIFVCGYMTCSHRHKRQAFQESHMRWQCMHMLVPQTSPEAQTVLQQSLQVKPDGTIDAGDVLKRILPWSLVEHGLMTTTSMGEVYDKRLQSVQRLAGLHKHADGYGILHALPSLRLVLRISTCCTCWAHLMGWSQAEPQQVLCLFVHNAQCW